MTDDDVAAPRVSLALKATALLLLAICLAQLAVTPGSHDDLHHAHAAYRFGQGERPYVDFLHVNSVAMLYIQDVGRLVGFEGPEILYWQRVLCALSMLGTCLMLGLIGERLGGPGVGWTAVVLYAPGAVCPWAHTLLYKFHHQFRPEILGMPLTLAALWIVLRSGDPDRPPATFRRMLLGGLCAAAALSLTPRAVFPILAMVGLLILRRRLTLHGWLGVAAGALAAVAFYALAGGVANTYHWLFRYAGDIAGSGGRHPLATLRMDPAREVIALGMAAAVWHAWRGRGLWRDLSIVQLLASCSLLIERDLSMASWQFFWILGCPQVAYLVVGLARRGRLGPVAAVGLVLLCSARAVRVHVHSYRLWTTPAYRLSGQVAAYRAFGAAVGDEPVMLEQKYHAIVTNDGSYYWSQRNHLLRRRGLVPAPEVRVLEEVLAHPPAVLEPKELLVVCETDEQRARAEALIAGRYRRTQLGFLVRDDLFERLAPLLDRHEIAVHLRLIRKS